MSISNDEWTLKVFHPDGCCNVVEGLTLAGWEKGVVWDVGLGVGSVSATHNNYLVVTVLFCAPGRRDKITVSELYLMPGRRAVIGAQ